MKRNMKTLAAAVMFLAAGQVSAGGTHSHAHDSDAIGKPGDAANVSRTLEVVMRDNYYEPEAIAVQAGETVRFSVENAGVLVHEFNIGTAAMHAAHKDEMLMMMKHGVLTPTEIDRDKMASGDHSMQHDDPNSVLLEPGEKAEVIWTFAAAGDLEFACNIPGHYESGMVGEIELQ